MSYDLLPKTVYSQSLNVSTGKTTIVLISSRITSFIPAIRRLLLALSVFMCCRLIHVTGSVTYSSFPTVPGITTRQPESEFANNPIVAKIGSVYDFNKTSLEWRPSSLVALHVDSQKGVENVLHLRIMCHQRSFVLSSVSVFAS